MIAIVLVNWNGWQDTIECLESIYLSKYKKFQVFVVDNGSTDSSLEYISAWANGELCVWCPPNSVMRQYSHPPIAKKLLYIVYNLKDNETVTTRNENKILKTQCDGSTYPLILIKSETNLGFGEGNNIVLRYIKSMTNFKYIWLLNNDTVITSQSLSQMVDVAQSHSGITGSILKFYFEPNMIQAYGGGYFSEFSGRVVTETKSKASKLNLIIGASFMMDKKLLDTVGFFDQNIFMYFEETDYCIRAKKMNYSCLCSDAIVFHKVGCSTSFNSYFSWYNIYKNKFYSLKKNYGFGLWFFIFVGSLVLNSVRPFVNINKKRASRDVLFEKIIWSK
ncbi:glycosyltransferase family 2 protein [Candidatus Roizmanbacteria bacterium]|nr:glycosyltransferase family 2 protein [Candidatus Roizmanbacteria bacterium]